MSMVHWWCFPTTFADTGSWTKQVSSILSHLGPNSRRYDQKIYCKILRMNLDGEFTYLGGRTLHCVSAMILTTSIAGRLRAWWPQKVDWTCGSGSQNWYCWAGYNVYRHTWWQEWVDWNNVGIGTLQQDIFGNRDSIGWKKTEYFWNKE